MLDIISAARTVALPDPSTIADVMVKITADRKDKPPR
jgi:hypothetical protein